MIDSLSSSALYMEFDEDRKGEVGYRLPADPYWLSPPQGSIVPVWHRGAAPNYQPKPMICRHVQDPVKAWRRETCALPEPAQQGPTGKILDTHETRPRIRLFTCSAGVNAAKMANKLYDTLQRLLQGADGRIDVVPSQPLNKLDLSGCSPEDVILIIASTTGRGEIPRNAAGFLKHYESAEPLTSPPRFSCFANGDSTYGDTYNAAAKVIQQLMNKLGCRPLLGHCFAGDTAVNNPDWDSFNQWLENINHLIIGSHHKTLPHPSLMERQSATPTEMPTATLVKMQRLNSNAIVHITLDIGDREYQEMDHIKVLAPNPDYEVERVLSLLRLSASHRLDWHHQSAWDFLSRYVDLDHHFRELDWYPGFNELPTQKQEYMRGAKVVHVLEELKSKVIFTSELVERICKDMASITPRLYSAASCPEYLKQDAIREEGSGNMLDIMVKVNPEGRFSEVFLLQAQLGAKMRFGLTTPDTFQMIQAQKPNAPLIAIVTGSGIGPIRAILQRRIVDISRTTGDDDSPVNTGGSASNHLLSLSPTSMSPLSRQPFGGNVDYYRTDRLNNEIGSPATPSLKRQWSWGRSVKTHRRRAGSVRSEEGAPAEESASRQASIAGNGSRSRRASMSSHLAHLNVPSTRGSVSLFVGFKNEDSDLIQQVIRPASQAALLDVMELVPSNAEKIRVQDHLLIPHIKEKLSRKLQDPSCIVFICANEMAATAAGANLNSIAGTDIKNLLGERYIEEVFRG
jgi:sulfite reductase alpha subunit-like flavoprotein